MKCALVGDFNAKTAVLEDFSEPIFKMSYLSVVVSIKIHTVYHVL
jgi:hypothetical protein